MRHRGWLRAASGIALRLYPDGWQAQYGPELEDILDHRRLSAFTVLDLTLSALSAHRNPEFGITQVFSMTARLRSSIVSILIALVIFAIAWASVLSVRDPLPAWLAAVDMHPELRLAVGLVQLSGAVALLAILGGGLVLLASASLRRDDARRGTGRPLAVATAAFAVFLGLLVAAAIGLFGTLNTTIGPGPASGLWVAGLPSCVVVGVAAVARAVARSAPDPTAIRLCLILGLVGVIGMAFTVIGSVWLGAAVTLDAPEIGAPVLLIIPMVVAALWAAAALRRAAGEMTIQRPFQ